MTSDSDSSSHSSDRRVEPPVRHKRPRADFTEENVDYDQPFSIPDPPYIHNWEKYPSFIDKLVYGKDVPPPPPAKKASSSQTPTTTLPPLQHPIEQVLAALMAAFDSEKQNTEKRIDNIYDSISSARDTRHEVKELKKECSDGWECHNNLAEGVQKLYETVEELKAELKATKAEQAADRAELATVRAELDIVIEDLGQANQALVVVQHQNTVLSLRVEELEEQGAVGMEEEQEEGIGREDLEGDPIELEEEEEEPKVIDP